MPFRPLRQLKPELFTDEQFFCFPFENVEDLETETETESRSQSPMALQWDSDVSSLQEYYVDSCHGDPHEIIVGDVVPLLPMTTPPNIAVESCTLDNDDTDFEETTMF